MPQNGRIIVDRIPIVTVGNLTQKCDISFSFFREQYQYNGNVTLIKKENIHLNLSTNYENNSAKKSNFQTPK